MNHEEARQVLLHHLEQYRGRSYSDLVGLVDTCVTAEIVAPSGTKYQIEVQGLWDDKPHGNLRVLGTIDDYGWRALHPLAEAFILAPSGSFVGE